MSRKPSKAELSFLMGWHGLLSGSFLVAYLTEDATYAMHVFSGVTVLLALGIRLLVGLAAPKGSPLALPSLSLPPSGGSSLSFQAIKRLINNWMAVGLLILITLAALSGCWSLTCATFKSRPYPAGREAWRRWTAQSATS